MRTHPRTAALLFGLAMLTACGGEDTEGRCGQGLSAGGDIQRGAAPLTCQFPTMIALSPAALTIPSTTVGAMGFGDLTLTNTGYGVIEIASVETSDPEVSVEAFRSALAPQATTPLELTFRPASAGTKDVTVTVTAVDATSVQATAIVTVSAE